MIKTGVLISKPGRMRDALGALLTAQAGLDQLVHHDQLDAAVAAIAAQQPAVVLIDFDSVCVQLQRVLGRIKTVSPQTRTLVLTGNRLQHTLARLNGADGVLMKGCQVSAWLHTLEAPISTDAATRIKGDT